MIGPFRSCTSFSLGKPQNDYLYKTALSRRNKVRVVIVLTNNVFSKNINNTDFVRRNTHSYTDSNTQTNSGPVTTATIPYIRGTSETIARILQPYNIRVAHKPITTLRRLLTNVKDKDKPEDRQGAVYKIKCCDCQASYIGETGRNLSTRLTEQKRATKNGDVNNHIAEHHLK